MGDDTQLLYLEPDDEITTVVRRLREANAARVVLVASGRTKATTSAVALRLLAQVAAEEGREVVLVADPAARALAAEAGIPAFASVAEANAEGAVALPPTPTLRAPIHVVRGELASASIDQTAAHPAPAPPMPVPGLDETQAVPVPQPAPRTRAPRPARRRGGPPAGHPRLPRALLAAVLALLVLAGAAMATVVPAATVTLRPQAVLVGPVPYSVRPEVHPPDAEPLTSTMEGEATGHRTRRTAARGVVTFRNYAAQVVFVPAGTVVSSGGEIFFETASSVSVPDSSFFFPGEADADVVAIERGPEGNLAVDAIDRVEDKQIDRALRDGAGSQNRRVFNRDPTSGGDETELTVVRDTDVTRVTDALKDDLDQQLTDLRAGLEGRIYADEDPPAPHIEVPKDLVGHVSRDAYTFKLTGTLLDDQPFALEADVIAEGTQKLLDDESAVPEGTSLQTDSVEVRPGAVSLKDDAIVVRVDVRANALPDFDRDAVPGIVSGKTRKDAVAALRRIGPATVDLWPGWVDHVPGIEWRIRVEIQPAVPAE
jgi:hypothetical protein